MSGIGPDDPYAEPGSTSQQTEIETAAPAGGNVTLHDDGGATLHDVIDTDSPMMGGHFDNLATVVDSQRLREIATDFLEAVEIDKKAREKRDKQYEEGLRRTGLGDDAPGGATFPGASRVVHPMLTEACIDFASRVMPELFPPTGPCKTQTFGDPTSLKDDRAERTSRWINYQLTETIPNVYHEMEVGFSQCSLGGAFYTKMASCKDTGISVVQIPIDKVHRPWSDGSIYDQVRITHEMEVDRWEYDANVASGLWVDVLNPSTSTDNLQQTRTSRSNDRVTGRTEPTRNIDNERLVFESSVLMPLMSRDDPAEPFILTVDEQTREVLGIYRNWKENDQKKKRLTFLIEWPFWPWRGGVPIGMAHMIGGLSGAATGALRALLDSAHLNNSQTGVHLKGGATAGGQNVRASPMQTTTISGSLSQDDVRKAYMQLKFNEPSPTLFQLLGFLVDAGRGVVRTTFDEFDKMTDQTPVGTANMFIEQGLKNLGAIHTRMHRSMRLFLRQLWDINADTVNDEQVMDQFGELIVTRADFAGPMTVMPVSDPNIFSDMQRQTMAQMVVQRAESPIGSSLYNQRKKELYFLKAMKVPDAESLLVPQAEPIQQNAVAENVTASKGLPIQAYPGQDHEAHLAMHIAYTMSPLFGSNLVIAPKFLPLILAHLGEHIALWYSDAMLDAANAVLRQRLGRSDISIESLKGTVYEAPLDRLLAELSPEVFTEASTSLKAIPQAVAQAQMLLQRLAPQQPMDPSVVAMQDVTRQTTADENTGRLKLLELQNRSQESERKDNAAAQKAADELEAKHRQLDLQEQDSHLRAVSEANKAGIAQDGNESREAIAQDNNQAKVAVAQIDTESAETIADKNIAAGKTTRLRDGGSLK